MSCAAEVKTEDGRTLVCVLDEGHSGPVHEDDSGEQWGDAFLPGDA